MVAGNNAGVVTRTLPALECNNLLDSILYEFETITANSGDTIRSNMYIVSIEGSPYNCFIKFVQNPTDSELIIPNMHLIGYIFYNGDYFIFDKTLNTEWNKILCPDLNQMHEFQIRYRLIIFEKEWIALIKDGKLKTIQPVDNSDEKPVECSRWLSFNKKTNYEP